MRLVSWNVNGIRASMEKGFRAFVEAEEPDVICLQETKAWPEQVDLGWAGEMGYFPVWNKAEKKGYSGTLILSKTEPKNHELGLGMDEHDQEGRVITADFGDFYLTNVYTPNSQNELKRLDYRQKWDADFLAHMLELNEKKPAIFCGDLNVAHKEIDLANPKSNRKNAGFTDEERAGFDKIVEAGFVDSFREFDPNPERYSWWSFRAKSRERNVGWRIDYFCVPEKFWDRVKNAGIQPEIMGSDHCPVTLELE